MRTRQNYGGLDAFRLIAAILVVAIHTSPLGSFHAEPDFFLTRILARTAVPFFFMVTGQFVLSGCISENASDNRVIWKYVKKTALLYGAAILLYLPIGFYAGHYQDMSITALLRMLIFDGTFYHLWYFPACITGILIISVLARFLSIRSLTAAALLLYIIGLFGDSYHGLIAGIPGISTAYEWGFGVFSYTRNGFFLAPVFLLMGALLGRQKRSLSPAVSGTGFAISFLAMTAEGFILRYFSLQRHDSMYVCLIPCMFFLYQLLMSWNRKPSRNFRTVSTWVYILHPIVIICVRGAAKAAGMTKLLVDNSMIHYLTVCILSYLVSMGITMLINRRKKKSFHQGRAWIELNRSALQENVAMLRSRLPESCELMPAVKADAYGHGAVLIAKELNHMGIKAFCVACVSEGAKLRKHGVKGDILVLGYTHPEQFPLLRLYHLTQTVIDYPYAVLLNRYGKKLHVHIGIDTGMHRLGERSENIDQLCKIFQMQNLMIDGLFTHLCADDTLHPEDQAFTALQTQAFYHVIDELKHRGCPCPKIHLQSSYGIFNYPELSGDYARVGIALYGMLSTKDDTENAGASLRPVLTLKARIATIKDLYAGEPAGYGMQFTAEHDMKIATLAIGYADGLPRALSNGSGFVLINGQKAPIIGRICMDQTIIDITNIPDAKAGSAAVIIGESENERITAADIAESTNTIANEVLSRLGARLERIII